MFYRWIIERNGTWWAMASSLLCFQGIQRDPKGSKGPEAKRPSSPHSWKIKWNIWQMLPTSNKPAKKGFWKKIQPFVTFCYEFVTLVTLGYTWIHLAQLKEACPWLMCSPWYMGLLKRIHCNRGILTSGWKIRVNWPAQFSLTHRRRTNNNCCSCATMEEAYKAPWITKTCLTSSSYPESDHRIISKPKWTNQQFMHGLIFHWILRSPGGFFGKRHFGMLNGTRSRRVTSIWNQVTSNLVRPEIECNWRPSNPMTFHKSTATSAILEEEGARTLLGSVSLRLQQ